eukprot:TRINITY_DN1723_c0_g1_i1.p1 TRINITY_DN1723_c0_g1~~TRINITY_DN1723_c0_g1_i1.p1  ORF type:complete len:124 (-),score=15.69 TRINITY_DN1723_c0_g1_i1:444-815(-)
MGCRKSVPRADPPAEETTGPRYFQDWSTYYESEDEPATVRPVPQGSLDGKVKFFWRNDGDGSLPGSPSRPVDESKPAGEEVSRAGSYGAHGAEHAGCPANTEKPIAAPAAPPNSKCLDNLLMS